MRFIIVTFISLLMSLSCKNEAEKQMDEDHGAAPKYVSFGKKITADDAEWAKSMLSYYHTLKVGDTMTSKFKATVSDVCQVKGCWMKLTLDDKSEVMVRFKDYGFFVPKTIKNKEVIVSGLAYIDELTVEDQRHYAEDAGQPSDEISRITEPKHIFAFEADGVLLKH
ncbi:DUF4920 domain-containing protein [Aestuariivivens sediminis]|uniref:DUF4920 domain-containing protein n=1 Tax=Aestuariivivens sediminis TaxID=2913557 RepID=UPI001F59559D|nr:DUF4920 domain-containing protein [Aestuariivivens sediminis]